MSTYSDNKSTKALIMIIIIILNETFSMILFQEIVSIPLNNFIVLICFVKHYFIMKIVERFLIASSITLLMFQ